MNKINKKKFALSFSLFITGLCVVWSLVVSVGLGQSFLNFVFWMHMINIQYTLDIFQFKTALVLIITASVIGYVLAWMWAFIWNWLSNDR